MVKVELSYNPYLLETIVKFNGQEPRINSLVEKYQNGAIQDWIDIIPIIFHDEMNGYDFELDFSGVKRDFNAIVESFSKAGVPDNCVHFFYKNYLENPIEKNERMNALLHWLDDNRNRRFNYDEFKQNNIEIFDTPYSYITIHGKNTDFVELAGKKINVENVEDVNELMGTDLSNTPIIMFIDGSNGLLSRKNLQCLLKKDDVRDEQVFFYISPTLNKAQIERTILDLGMLNPKIIQNMDDAKIEDYFEVYPLTKYIKKLLDIFRENTNAIKTVLDKENEISKVKNFEIHAKIDLIENDLEKLKIADDKFVQRDNLNCIDSFEMEYNNMINQILGWRRKKTKTNNEEEAERLAYEYDMELEKIFSSFCEKIKKIADDKKTEIDCDFNNWFVEANVDTTYSPSFSYDSKLKEVVLPKLFYEFLQLKTEEMVEQKGDIFNIFRGNAGKESKERVLQITFSYEVWRTKAENIYKPIAVMIITDRINTLTNYYDELSKIYHKHIEELILQKTEQKDNIALQLSDDEKLLQVDNDWLETFNGKLHVIERG